MSCVNDSPIRSLRLLIAIVSISIGLLMVPTIPRLRADTVNPGVYPIDSKPFGLTYGGWSAKWWQWSAAIPKDANPTADTSGKNCVLGQNDQHVWFLSGTGGGSAERTCNIPVGKAILFPVLNAECTYKDSATAKTPSDLRSCAIESDAGVTTLLATVDGRNIQNVEQYRVTSNLFNVTLPNNNIMGVTPGPTEGVSDCWCIILYPLPAGNHEIHFVGVLGSPTVIPTLTNTNPRFASEVTYHITVK